MPEVRDTLLAQHRVVCDVCGETRRSVIYDPTEHGSRIERDHLDQLAREGWRAYAGRSRRIYCPNCSPRPGHRMELVLGSERHV